MAVKTTIGRGWHSEPERHSLSARGISTGRRAKEKVPFLMKTLIPHIAMGLGISFGSREFLNRRAKTEDAVDTLKSRGWRVKFNPHIPMLGAWEAYKGANYLQLDPTHWKKVFISKITLVDPNEAVALRKLFRKPYPYKIPEYAKGVPEGWVRVKWVDALGGKWDDNIPKGGFADFKLRVMGAGGHILKTDYARKDWKNTSKKYSDGSESVEWTSNDKKLSIDKDFEGRGWNIAVTSLKKGELPQLMADTHNKKQQAYKKAYKYMRENH
jgi:hypothetical protein